MANLDATAPLRSDAEPPRSLQSGTTLDQYVVLGLVGSGGAGDVYVAWDNRLDRRVALKMLRPHREHEGATLQPDAFALLVSEARLLAKLSHPNVVTVHDIRRIDDVAFIAMEYVEGVDLSTHLEDHPLAWTEVVRIFVAAGRGIAAAHEAGIVHGDLKPANILLGADGRPRVSDFGVARSVVEHDTAEHAVSLSDAEDGMSASVEASTPVLVGTPYAMAPEQHRGLRATIESDIYGFCVSLWQALYGSPPFRAPSNAELEEAKLQGAPPAPSNSAVPRWLHGVVARGLAPDPAARPRRLRELLDTLQRTPGRRRQRITVAGGTIAVAALGAASLATGNQDNTCTDAHRHLAGIWDPPRRTQLAQTFENSGLVYAPASWEQVNASLQTYADAWAQMHEEACEATQRGEQSSTLLDLRMACLDRRRVELGALVEQMAQGGAEIIERSARAAGSLTTLDPCDDTERLLDRDRIDTQPRTAAVVEVETSIAQAIASFRLGRYEAGIGFAEDARSEAARLEHEPLQLEAIYERGRLEAARGEFETAETSLSKAAWDAEALGLDPLSAQAQTQCALVVGHNLQRHAEGLLWASHAEATIRRIGSPPVLQGQLLSNRSVVQLDQGEHAAAVRDASGAVERLRDLGRPLSLAGALDNLSNALMAVGDGPGSQTQALRALQIYREQLGPAHPSVATTLSNLSDSLMRMEDFEAARVRGREALTIAEAALGPDHPRVGEALVNLANALAFSDDVEAAKQTYRRALKLYQGLDPHHRHVGSIGYNLGLLLLDREEHDEARPLLQLALEVWEEVLGPKHPQLGLALGALGVLEREQGDVEQSIVWLERAVDLGESSQTDPATLADARFQLAQSLIERDRSRALELAGQARATFVRTADGEMIDASRRWFEDNGATAP